MQKRFPVRLAKAMDDRSVTVAILADRVGLSRQSVTNYVNGAAEPSVSRAYAIARALGVSLDWLAGANKPGRG